MGAPFVEYDDVDGDTTKLSHPSFGAPSSR
jgi:hypothetical protein